MPPSSNSLGQSPNNTNQGGPVNELPQPPLGNPLPVQYPQPVKNKKKKLLLSIGGGVAIIAAGVAIYVFGFYIPNLPENVWKSSLERSGQAVNAATSQATSKEMVAKYAKSAFDGTFSFNSKDASGAGTFSAKADGSNATANADTSFKFGDQPQRNLQASLVVNQAKNSVYPTIYFKLKGLQDMGLESLGPLFAAYDNKWISIDQDYFKAMGIAPTDTPAPAQQVTAQDVADAAKSAITTTTAYVFTTDPSKAVWERKSFVGKEKVDGVNTYHYTISINAEHARAYCQAVTVAYLQTTMAKKVIPDAAERERQTKEAASNCKTDVDDKEIAKSSYDLWTDVDHKVLYKARITDNDNKANYSEVGQKYDGSSTLHFFMNTISHEAASQGSTASSSTVKATFDINTNAATAAVSLTANGGDGTADGNYSFKASASSKPYQGTIDATAPNGATPIMQILQGLFGASQQASEL